MDTQLFIEEKMISLRCAFYCDLKGLYHSKDLIALEFEDGTLMEADEFILGSYTRNTLEQIQELLEG